LTGGASSLTFAGVLDGRRVVVKVAPPGLPPTGHRDVLRQARVIRALGSAAVPVPEILAEDGGEPPDVPPLFVMSFCAGASTEPLFDIEPSGLGVRTKSGADKPAQADPSDSAAVIADRFREAARTMAALHRPLPADLGLGDEPVVAPGAEVDKWCRSLNTVEPALVPQWQEVADALRSATPSAMAPALVHGDFRLGNLLADERGINAVVDWEIWSVGDPRVDVGWFLINADPSTYQRTTTYRGVTPPVGELVDVYCDALGRDVPDLQWFQALACFKSAATWSLIVKHNRRRPAPDPALEQMADVLPALLVKARNHLD
jgi:aminoglycoside phosphotransferase (APT) family kinase protein